MLPLALACDPKLGRSGGAGPDSTPPGPEWPSRGYTSTTPGTRGNTAVWALDLNGSRDVDDRLPRNCVTQIVRALRVQRGYRSAVAVLGRSSIRTWLDSVLSLCAPHWGQRSADDHAPHREHVLCVRFGTTALPYHRCRSFNSSNAPTIWPPSKSISACHRIWRLPGSRNIINQFHPNWKPRRCSLPSSLGSRVPGAGFHAR